MNDDINTLAWSPIARDFAEIFSEDSERRQRLRECTPLPWDTTPRHWEGV